MTLIEQAKKAENQPPIDSVLSPINRFIEHEASSGILLCFTTVLALIWANSPFGESYFTFWQTPLMVGVGEAVLEKPLLKWINDGLMALFFFVVGLEIKREALVGELSAPRQALLPVTAAIGGMVFPALCYLLFNIGGPGENGWAIPMATDIAFALGVLALLGDRAPIALKIFLVALTIVDDLVSVLVIAIFYSSKIVLFNLMVGGGNLLLLVLCNALGIRHPLVYALLGIGGVWLAFLLSGIHATIAGVLVALTIPAKARTSKKEFLEKINIFMNVFQKEGSIHGQVLASQKQAEAAEAVKVSGELVQAPLQRIENILGPWVAFGIIPVFAFANAGIAFQGSWSVMLSHSVPLGIMFGLLIGKQVGITFFTWLIVHSGVAKLPENVTWRQIYGVGWLGGIGFTMSIFITNLAFQAPEVINIAKSGILISSLLAGVIGWVILRKPRLTS
ncbi:MAG: Na+/H+ antiporter NhaA [Nitrospira sp.]|nr:Na+/H+ antiporter NhaA [Nitrospira sp.]